MRILVIGGAGMLGHRLAMDLPGYDHEVWATVKGPVAAISGFGIAEKNRLIGNVNVMDLASVDRALDLSGAEVVINAAGIVKQRKDAAGPVSSIAVNSLFPHQLIALAEKRKIRVLSVSTDCVFSGKSGGYSEADAPDAADLYGRSKLLGELDYGNSLTLRTSMIGRELNGCRGLLEWFLANRDGRVRGFTKAYFSGLTTIRLARIIGKHLVARSDLKGIYHLASERISKYELLCLIRDALGIHVEIEAVDEVVLDRSLNADKLLSSLGINAPGWNEMMDELASDDTPYDEWRKKIT